MQDLLKHTEDIKLTTEDKVLKLRHNRINPFTGHRNTKDIKLVTEEKGNMEEQRLKKHCFRCTQEIKLITKDVMWKFHRGGLNTPDGGKGQCSLV